MLPLEAEDALSCEITLNAQMASSHAPHNGKDEADSLHACSPSPMAVDSAAVSPEGRKAEIIARVNAEATTAEVVRPYNDNKYIPNLQKQKHK